MAPEALARPQLLTPKAAAAALAISPRKLWALTASGDVPCVRFPNSRCVRYDAVDLHAVIDAAKEQSR